MIDLPDPTIWEDICALRRLAVVGATSMAAGYDARPLLDTAPAKAEAAWRRLEARFRPAKTTRLETVILSNPDGSPTEGAPWVTAPDKPLGERLEEIAAEGESRLRDEVERLATSYVHSESVRLFPRSEIREMMLAAYEEGYRHGYGNGQHDCDQGEPWDDDPDLGDSFQEWLTGQGNIGAKAPFPDVLEAT